MPEIPKALYECHCGYSLRAAYNFMSQQEISQMMLKHLESIHGIEK
jgi:hypothetical protein